MFTYILEGSYLCIDPLMDDMFLQWLQQWYMIAHRNRMHILTLEPAVWLFGRDKVIVFTYAPGPHYQDRAAVRAQLNFDLRFGT